MNYTMNRPRGFAALTPERRKEIAAAAGKRAHELGVAHTWTSKEAAQASRKGWKETPQRVRRKRKARSPEPIPLPFEDLPAVDE